MHRNATEQNSVTELAGHWKFSNLRLGESSNINIESNWFRHASHSGNPDELVPWDDGLQLAGNAEFVADVADEVLARPPRLFDGLPPEITMQEK